MCCIFLYVALSTRLVEETGAMVRCYPTTAESVSPSGIKITLHGRDLWEKFNEAATEMIITKAGR